MRILVAYFLGLLFGLGIVVSGMGNPAKVLNFFDVAGRWDPSLAFVIIGALATTFIGYRLVLARSQPVFEAVFRLPTRTSIDARLVGGSALFGVGWGIAGFCPGGALPMLGTGDRRVFLFVAACAIGILATRYLTSVIAPQERGGAPTDAPKTES